MRRGRGGAAGPGTSSSLIQERRTRTERRVKGDFSGGLMRHLGRLAATGRGPRAEVPLIESVAPLAVNLRRHQRTPPSHCGELARCLLGLLWFVDSGSDHRPQRVRGRSRFNLSLRTCMVLGVAAQVRTKGRRTRAGHANLPVSRDLRLTRSLACSARDAAGSNGLSPRRIKANLGPGLARVIHVELPVTAVRSAQYRSATNAPARQPLPHRPRHATRIPRRSLCATQH